MNGPSRVRRLLGSSYNVNLIQKLTIRGNCS